MSAEIDSVANGEVSLHLFMKLMFIWWFLYIQSCKMSHHTEVTTIIIFGIQVPNTMTN